MKRLKSLILFFMLVVLIGMIGRTLFYLVHHDLIASGGDTSYFPMLWHGLRLDLSVAGYASILPALLMLVAEWWNGKALLWIWRTYLTVVVTAVVLAFSSNIVLYGYWGFPLDSTPLFYLFTSPMDAMASVPLWQLLLGLAVVVVMIFLLCYCMERCLSPKAIFGVMHQHCDAEDEMYATLLQTQRSDLMRKIVITFVYLLFAGIMFIFIRGGFTVATNNVGTVYFSNNVRLNHASVNPVFSFLESVAHTEDFASEYRFMDDAKAASLFDKMIHTAMRDQAMNDSLLTPAFRKAIIDGKCGKGEGARVIVVIMESFSRYIMSDGGHVKGVTPHLDRLATEGLYFTEFYANSFRTDRGLMAILSGFPAQPTMSLMKYSHKTNNLYSIARSLKAEGYATEYVYGGDANFTNMRSYLKSTGFDDVVAEENFDKSIARNKWGVDDDALFTRALQNIDRDRRNRNVFRVIQTSSSHEPFDVPFHRLKNKRLNAFCFTDDCIGRFVAQMKKRSDWNRTLLVFVADHLGCYPEGISNYDIDRYRIPLVMAGGAVQGHRRIGTIGSQQDIAATLLALLGKGHDEFVYSKDLLDAAAPHFAFFAVPDAMGMVTEDNTVIYDNTSRKAVVDRGKRKGKNVLPAQAYLQKIYDDIATR